MAEIVSILQSVKLKHGSAHRQLVDTSGSDSDGHSDDAGNCSDAGALTRSHSEARCFALHIRTALGTKLMRLWQTHQVME
jgi:hypothetical protein